MNITLSEFSRFNNKSQFQLLQHKGRFLMERKLASKKRLCLYRFNNNYIEVLVNNQNEVLSITPVINPQFIELYTDEINIDHLLKLTA